MTDSSAKLLPESEILEIGPRPGRRPPWIKVRAPAGETYEWLRDMMRSKSLHTVCEEARCPNLGECWGAGTATFLLMGDTCTRSCGFCDIQTGRPSPLDWLEPERVARAVQAMDLRHAVITSVNRDDDNLGGARIFASTIAEIRRTAPRCRVEVLIPDFQGDDESLRVVLGACPDVLNHNTETVPRLYRAVRSGARYERSLRLLENVKKFAPGMASKSGVMVGLGETMDELLEVFRHLAARRVDILTVGQYLRPSKDHLPIARYYTPEEFRLLKQEALGMGFRHVESGPLVRSSYHAHEQAESAAIGS